MTPIAKWLRDARLAQTHPETGRPWSQEYLAERVTAETGWTLYRANYIGYEKGKGMQPETLARFIAFWEKYGVAAPDLTPQAEPLSLEERQLALLERQVIAAERQAEAAIAQTAMWGELVAELRRLRGVHEGLSDGLGEVLGALTVAAAGSPSPQGTHTGTGRQ